MYYCMKKLWVVGVKAGSDWDEGKVEWELEILCCTYSDVVSLGRWNGVGFLCSSALPVK